MRLALVRIAEVTTSEWNKRPAVAQERTAWLFPVRKEISQGTMPEVKINTRATELSQTA